MRCRSFSATLDALWAEGESPTQYRLERLGPLDHEIVVRDPRTARPKRLVCFDSNSYLGLHLHPRVVAAAHRALVAAGAGTPSAPLLSSTSRWLRELEDVVAAFLGRESALVFPSGYAANVGILTGLLSPGDFAVRDRHVHARLHDGCRLSGARGGVYAQRDPASAARALARDGGRGGRLPVTDGVFSMHGRVAPLPELATAARDAGALLMVDEAHPTGVVAEANALFDAARGRGPPRPASGAASQVTPYAADGDEKAPGRRGPPRGQSHLSARASRRLGSEAARFPSLRRRRVRPSAAPSPPSASASPPA